MDSRLRAPVAWRDEITLVPFSGVQTLDFGFDLDRLDFRRRFVERTRSETDAELERVLIPLSGDPARDAELVAGTQAKGAEEYGVDARKAIEPFDGEWIPAPVLRLRREPGPYQAEVFDHGPAAWARIRVVSLAERDAETGHTHRVQIAFDTALVGRESDARYQRPVLEDASTPRRFRFTADPEHMAWFLRAPQTASDGREVDLQAWVSLWLEDLWMAHLNAGRQGRAPVRIEDRPRRFEHWARYLTLLALVETAVRVPTIRFCDTVSGPDAQRPVEVDLVLDIGNSRTCGLLVERFPDATETDLTKAFPLEMRDLGRPEWVYRGLFESAVEFSEVSFGDERCASRSGVNGAFLWPGLVRVGTEARRLMEADRGTEAAAGLSAPKRYLWDDDEVHQDWRFHLSGTSGGLPRSVRAAMQFLTQAGDVIEQVRWEEEARIRRTESGSITQAIRPRFSRSACYGLMLAEILAHAIVQVNDPGGRALRREADLPRRLARIILTLPTATTAQEQAIIRSRAEGALKLIWSVTGAAHVASTTALAPQIIVEWDEASCTQLVWLYNELQETFGGRIEGYFSLMGAPRPEAPGSAPKPSLRVASLDIGGGTTDLMITEYFSEEDRVLRPRQIFREGFRVAGDDLLARVIASAVLPALRADIEAAGGVGIDKAMSALFGGARGGEDQQYAQTRRLFALQVLTPLALSILHQAEADTRPDRVFLDATALRFYSERVTPEIEAFIEKPMSERGASWRLRDFRREISAEAFEAILRDTFYDPLADMLEVVRHVGVDALLLTGRPTRLPALRNMVLNAMVVSPDRVIAMDQYRVEGWYPFRDPLTHRIEDPKSTVAVGAMLMALASNRLPNLRVDTSAYRMRSTARFIGPMEVDGQIREDRVLFRDLDLDGPRSEDTAEVTMHTPIHLGFRQLPHQRWTATPLYRIDFANPGATDLKIPLRLTIERAERMDEDDEMSAEQRLRAEALKEAFEITDLEDREGGGRRSDVRLKLQTLGFSRDYWLDSGIFPRA
jgi:hypothetical protein